MTGGLSIWHWLIIAAVFVLFFGAKRMPDAARSLGKSMRIFKSEVTQMQSESTAPAPAPTQQPQQELPVAQPEQPTLTKPQSEPKSV
ncbi:Sec-independent protein translocase subunit TatA [Nocardia arthritidis]|uniref:Sec-independent protein translocase protein TatA n=1 Tax=Nocardia arthritidis TaxID=228602 RepID=A0A6G9YIP7_9NOCA|nr:Sec-independent protein translocase subunit TatA [Nocardia arthritidis]QIS13129.1 twin-arginine translocase TatA/TatE family subunit [Nocardia arthritidis]